jgi:hypothetical protein
VRFRLQTEMTVRQCITAIIERMEQAPTKTRPELNGHIEKDGKFTLLVTSQVANSFNRTTRLYGTAEQTGKVTVIEGYVSAGVPYDRIWIVIAAVVFVGLIMFSNGNSLLGLATVFMGFALYIPLVGDYNNSEILLKELKRVTKGKDKAPNE